MKSGLILFQFIFLLAGTISAQQFTIFNTSNSQLPFNTVNCITISSANVKWIGTEFGLAKLVGNSWTIYNSTNSPLTDNAIRCIAISGDGKLWIGTFLGGLYVTDFNTWKKYDYNGSYDWNGTSWISSVPSIRLSDYYIRSILFDRADGSAWIGTSTGLCHLYANQTIQYYNSQNTTGLLSENITSIVQDSSGAIWFGSINGGLGRFAQNTFNFFRINNSTLNDNSIEKLAVDANNNIWIACPYGGINRCDANWDFIHYNNLNTNLTSHSFYDLQVLPNDQFILASEYDGLFYNENSSWVNINTSNSNLPDNSIQCLAKDSLGNIWMGTYNGGIAIYRPVLNLSSVADHTPTLSIYPNPASDQLFVESPISCTVKVYSIVGQEYHTVLLHAGNNSIDISELHSGVYLLKPDWGYSRIFVKN